MDDVKPVREMQRYFPTLPNEIIYVPDPKFYVLSTDGGVKLYKGESLVIEVRIFILILLNILKRKQYL